VAANANTTSRLSSLSGTRYQVWNIAIKEFKAHPVAGTGAGTFEFTWNERGTTNEFTRDAHNIWLQNMSELGVPGLLLIVAVAVAAVGLGLAVRVRARRATSAGVAAAFLALMLVYLLNATVDWMWESTAVTVLALAGIGILGVRLSEGPIRLRLPARATLVALAAGAAIVQLPGILSTSDIRRSQSAERAGNASAALALARDAVSAEPWSASAHEQQALVLEAEGRLSQAKHEESTAVSHEPTNYAHYLTLSRIETELGQLAAAVRNSDRARQLRPHAEVFALAPYFSGAPSQPAP
jgi:O-antigen ligase